MAAIFLIASWILLIWGGALGTGGEPIYGVIICMLGILFSFTAIGRFINGILPPNSKGRK